MGGDILVFTDWYKTSVIFLCGQHRKTKICKEPWHDMNEGGQVEED
jgi:hypothetical protein